MTDNHPEDKYFYEIVVETGPKDSHATTANIYFILAGSDEESGARSSKFSYFSRSKIIFHIWCYQCTAMKPRSNLLACLHAFIHLRQTGSFGSFYKSPNHFPCIKSQAVSLNSRYIDTKIFCSEFQALKLFILHKLTSAFLMENMQLQFLLGKDLMTFNKTVEKRRNVCDR